MRSAAVAPSTVVVGVLWFRLCLDTPTLPSTAFVITAVDKSPAYAKLSTVAPAGDLPIAPTTTLWDTTDRTSRLRANSAVADGWSYLRFGELGLNAGTSEIGRKAAK